MPVQAEASLQSQRVTSSQPSWMHFRLIDEFSPQLHSVFPWNENLEAVFSSVSASGNKDLHTVHHHVLSIAEVHVLEVVNRNEPLHDLDSLWSLQGVKSSVLPLDLHRYVSAELPEFLLEEFQILHGASSIDDLVDVIALLVRCLGDHGVIDDSSVFVWDHREGSLAHGKILNVSNRHALQKGDRILSTPAETAHVRNIEQSCLGTNMFD
mmetsp:Transcript_14042/g.48415  ORF Transcript_14042/g.48415 Transcript_14042/m.48415 type:complete len:210 (+) Transcript_14042:469-1098(+)